MNQKPIAHISMRVSGDDRTGAGFADRRTLKVDVMPGSDVNPVKVSQKGVIPVAALSSADFDATTLTAAPARPRTTRRHGQARRR